MRGNSPCAEYGEWKDHRIDQLTLTLVNDTSERIGSFDGKLWVKGALLKHWTAVYGGEVPAEDGQYRCFTFNESDRGPVSPRNKKSLYSIPICVECARAAIARPDPLIAAYLVDEYIIKVKAWVSGRELSAEKTIKELSIAAERPGA
jgi:hypothetical protein